MWLHLDRNDSTRSEIQLLVECNNETELEARLRHRIQFGTAGYSLSQEILSPGLRGRMEAGFSRMNHLSVIQASQVTHLSA